MKRRYCRFHKKDSDHFSSECNRNPANPRNSRLTEKEHKRSSSIRNNKPTSSKLPTSKHPGKPEASKYMRKIKQLFSSSEDEKVDEKEDTPEIQWLDEEEKKEIDALGRDTEDEATKTAKVEDNEEEKKDINPPTSSPLYIFKDNDLPSLTETEDSESDTENKGKALKTDPELERMKQKIGILEQEVKMTKMQTAIIK